jgi:hypothetical protein
MFRDLGDGTFRCGDCGHVLVEGYNPRSLVAIDIECFLCKTRSRTPAWPDGEPLPAQLFNFGAGVFRFKDTVCLSGQIVISDREIARVKASVQPRPYVDAVWELSEDSICALELELDLLTGGAYQKLVASSARAHRAGNLTFAQVKAPLVWALRELRAAIEQRRIDLDITGGIAISYVQLLRHSLQRWRHHPLFESIARSICSEFHHTIAAFTVAGYLADQGNKIGITDTANQRGQSPDLFIPVGKQERFSIEVKCPQALFWPARPPSREDVFRKIKAEVKDARDQITGSAGGLVVIGAGHALLDFDRIFEASINDVVSRGCVSTRIEAIVGVSFFSSQGNLSALNIVPFTTGARMFIAINHRFQGPRRIDTEVRQ